MLMVSFVGKAERADTIFELPQVNITVPKLKAVVDNYVVPIAKKADVDPFKDLVYITLIDKGGYEEIEVTIIYNYEICMVKQAISLYYDNAKFYAYLSNGYPVLIIQTEKKSSLIRATSETYKWRQPKPYHDIFILGINDSGINWKFKNQKGVLKFIRHFTMDERFMRLDEEELTSPGFKVPVSNSNVK